MASESYVKHVYSELENSTSHYDKLQKRWRREFPEDEEVNIQECAHRVWKTSNVPKFQSFQYRLMNRAVITNTDLERWKIKDTSMCSLCGKSEETYKHLFYECEYAQRIRHHIKIVCNELAPNIPLDTSYRNVMCDSIAENPRSVCNEINLCAKQYIYSKKCLKQTVTVEEFKRKVYMCRNIEKYHAIKTNNIVKYSRKWENGTVNQQTAEIFKQICYT